MLNDLFEVSENEGRYWVSPVDPKERAKYIIECRTKADAVRVVLQGNSPISTPAKFKSDGTMKNGALIYRPA